MSNFKRLGPQFSSSDTDSKRLESFRNKFYTKETKKETMERIKLCKFGVICGNLSEIVSVKQSSLNLSSFCGFVEMLVEFSAFV